MGVGWTSVAPSDLHTLFSSVIWWRAHNMLELGTDTYIEVVPAPQGVLELALHYLVLMYKVATCHPCT